MKHEQKKLVGHVRRFPAKATYGFIAVEDHPEITEAFVHIDNVKGRNRLQEGQRVEFEVLPRPDETKCHVAIEVQLAEAA